MTDRPKAPDPLPQTTTMRRLKRSRMLHVGSLMATAAFTMSACGSPQSRPVETAQPEPEPALAYTSLEECKSADVVPDADCDNAMAEAQQQARTSGPRYVDREACENVWGEGQCQTYGAAGSGFPFGPLAAGFIIGQMMNTGRYAGGGAIYRDRDDQYSTGGAGGYVYRDYRTGRTQVRNRDGDMVRQAPSRVQSRTAVVSRGGFGGGGRGYGG